MQRWVSSNCETMPPSDFAPILLVATSGQVCARSTPLEDAYELVTQSGGGGGGTDDQTAAEVPVTATGFSGNLGSTDTDVQTALDTIDGFTLGGGGGSHGHRRSVRGESSAPSTDIDIRQLLDATWRRLLECEATPSINEGELRESRMPAEMLTTD